MNVSKKRLGWRGESHRHRLSGYGIRTSSGIKYSKQKCSVNPNKIFYHATKKDINKFEDTGEPIFLSDDESFGGRYLGESSRNIKVKLHIDNPVCLSDELLEGLIIENMGDFPEQTERLMDDFFMSDAWMRSMVFNWLIDEGYDSIIIENDWDGGRGSMTSHVVFNPDNIEIIK